MADLLKMDPARIARLRDPVRLEKVDPESVLTVVAPVGDGPIVDVGAGVGFVSLPFARRFAESEVIACDILPGMLELLAQAASEEQRTNLQTSLMPGPTTLALEDNIASLLIMLQVHHELDDPPGLLKECHRVLAPSAPIVIIDWKDEDLPGISKGGRRVAESIIRQQLVDSGFNNVTSHDVYPIHSTVVGTAD